MLIRASILKFILNLFHQLKMRFIDAK